MNTDIYIIFLTAFAVFGFYSVFVMLAELYDSHNSPPTVTFIPYCTGEKTLSKIISLRNHIPNNTIVFITDKNEKVTETYGCTVYSSCDITPHIIRELLEKGYNG